MEPSLRFRGSRYIGGDDAVLCQFSFAWLLTEKVSYSSKGMAAASDMHNLIARTNYCVKSKSLRGLV